MQATLLELNQKLLDSIAGGDLETYNTLCDPTLTCFEPETKGHLVEGVAFHKYFFDLAQRGGSSDDKPFKNTTIASPHVRMLGDSAAVISYVRIVQSPSNIQTSQETRVWQKQADGHWLNVHFHRSC